MICTEDVQLSMGSKVQRIIIGGMVFSLCFGYAAFEKRAEISANRNARIEQRARPAPAPAPEAPLMPLPENRQPFSLGETPQMDEDEAMRLLAEAAGEFMQELRNRAEAATEEYLANREPAKEELVAKQLLDAMQQQVDTLQKALEGKVGTDISVEAAEDLERALGFFITDMHSFAVQNGLDATEVLEELTGLLDVAGGLVRQAWVNRYVEEALQTLPDASRVQ